MKTSRLPRGWCLAWLVVAWWISGSGSLFSAAEKSPKDYQEHIVAAARAGDGDRIMQVILESFEGNVSIGTDGATEMLDGLLRDRDLKAFSTLLGQMRMTNLGKDWQPNEELLAGLVRDKRKDFIDVLLASKLDVDRLAGAGGTDDAEMAEWTARRAAEVREERKNATLLVAAAGRGDVAEVGRLLDAGVDVNGVGADSHTPLTLAARENQAAVVRLLLARGAEVDKPKHPGWDYTPLCLTSSVEVADMLEAAGANVHAKLFKRDVSILTYVARFGGVDMVRWFLDRGLDPHMIGDNNETLLFDSGSAETTELLLSKGLDPNHENEWGATPIMQARDAGTARALIEAGAKVSGLEKPLLPRMIQFASGDAIEAVLEAGANRDPEEIQRALISAAHMDRADTARVLLKYGADPNKETALDAEGKHMMLPLMTCCIHGSPETAKVLLEHGADPNAGKVPGQMLATALRNGEKEVSEILRAAGAWGVSELKFAVATKDDARVKKLLSDAPDYQDDEAFWEGVLSAAARVGDVHAVRVAIEKGVPLDGDEEGGNPLESAAWEGQHETIEILLSMGKARNASPSPGALRAALWAAVWNSHPYSDQRTAEHFEKTIQMLIDAGAPVGEFEGSDNLVQAAVFTRYPAGNARVVEMLVKAGANPNPKMGERGTLMDVVETSCKTGGCSTPVMSTLQALARVAPEE